jgi:phage terminase large subunit-like protein
MLGLAIIGREHETRRWLHWGKAWIHKIVLQRRKSEASTFQDFADDGDLVITDDMEAAIGELAEIISTIDRSGLLAQVGLDPMGIGAIVDALAEKKITAPDRVVGISQGWSLNGAIKTTEIKLANGTFVHCGQRLLSYAMTNAKAEPKGNAITITKQASGAGKIDPLMALFDAVALMTRNPEPKSAVIEKGYELL